MTNSQPLIARPPVEDEKGVAEDAGDELLRPVACRLL
eukprot:CAMPEP_0185436326 /NCGR_PEP_ID=MMETSP1365-20130426/27613_1 /TAXON_ID=38817 /ORGANISM="Gephyrocapsa oceanica, Strain RCC1303" /LENGTH=36 /DNA_ID= /DNA_START= /DNA_END= /DNA_ORIENTATION=